MISLRNVEPTDAGWIFEACQDPIIQRWTRVPRPYLRTHAEEFVRGGTPEVHKWVICAGDEAIGLIGVHSITEGVAEIGYWVAPWGRGRRAVTQAIGLVVGQLRATGGVTSVRAVIAEGNAASRRAAEGAGMSVVAKRLDGCHDGTDLTLALIHETPID